MKRMLWGVLALCLGFMFTGCGGSGGGVTTQGPQTGVFQDSATQGLQYYGSDGVRKTTGTGGTFQYIPGSPVTFAIGPIVLGSLSGKAIVTPLDLIPGSNDPTNANYASLRQKALNITRFLMTLDNDGNPSNGIIISPTILTNAANLTQVDFGSATFDADIATVMSTLIPTGTPAFVPSVVAASHMDQSLFALYSGTYKGSYVTSFGDKGTFTLTIGSDGVFTDCSYQNISNSDSGTFSGSITANGLITLQADIDSGTGNLNLGTGTFAATINQTGGSGWVKFSGTMVTPTVSVIVFPSSGTLAVSTTQQFSAQVTGSANTGIIWSVSEGAAGGTITNSGLYSAPAAVGTYHVVATSVANPAKSTTITVTVVTLANLQT
ncbi:hypothetical protein GMLC_19150 [Geomonas limicola]|uniref:Uncharacterized protein n=1 Tax=Geomonas limicola TaxID=2740186 RepID=A0A6V8N6Y5_9BACT|nr:hypothetical protein [Geomonas limicola]GFO68336.1 hypothetical protein GMLC_19150 [Geomonas limicola]